MKWDKQTALLDIRARVMSYCGRTIRISAIQDITNRQQAKQANVLAEPNLLAQEIFKLETA